MIRVAAVGDLHVGEDSRGQFADAFTHVGDCADVLLLAGDLTRLGRTEEMAVLVEELAGMTVPCCAVAGNHDYESDRWPELAAMLRDAGVTVLEEGTTCLEVDGTSLGVVGTTGFGGGFAGASGSDFGEPEMKAFVRRTRRMADGLRAGLDDLGTDVRVALLHFAPIKDTLGAERREIYPFLGSYLLGEAIDTAGADLVVHGHAHSGTEAGVTPGGVPVRNVALPVIQDAFRVYAIG